MIFAPNCWASKRWEKLGDTYCAQLPLNTCNPPKVSDTLTAHSQPRLNSKNWQTLTLKQRVKRNNLVISIEWGNIYAHF